MVRTDTLSAYVISEPSTGASMPNLAAPTGSPYRRRLTKPEADCLLPCPGAVVEGMTVRQVLSDAGYNVIEVSRPSGHGHLHPPLRPALPDLLMISATASTHAKLPTAAIAAALYSSNGLLSPPPRPDGECS